MVRIGIDAMGGDFAPKNIVLGAIQAYARIQPKTRLVLFGDKSLIDAECREAGFDAAKFEIVHTSQVIGMGDHPAKAFQQKSDSSITVGFHALANCKIDGFASAGNTGAMLAGAMYTVKSIPGIIRPAICSEYPLLTGKTAFLLDVGLNVDCKPDVLYQYGLLGSIYVKHMMGIDNPRVALLNIGEEEEKGNLQTKEAFKMMQDTTDFNFAGNIEANHIFSGEIADVIVADGFVGNVVLKQAEAMYVLAKEQGIDSEYFNRFNYEIYGGTPVLGVNAPIIIGHGISSPTAIENMILQTEHAIKVRLVDKITEALDK
ncbi:MAG: phosphate acyltransferase PlsX [Bacteroidales bacterium]|nr:phosphate acyltransferase PlsX [Bacteroidales bacterium]MCL2133631.1 phosphate acyltransferase PlsX [Bacteroidales bacterium]